MTTRTVARTALLPGPPGAAWLAVMSPEIAPIIDPGVREWRPDREPIDVGTRFTIRGKLGVLPIHGSSEVVHWEPARRAVFESVQGSGPMKIIATHQFAPDGDGTRYTWRMDFTGPWPLAALGARLFGRAIDTQQRTLAAYLREHA